MELLGQLLGERLVAGALLLGDLVDLVAVPLREVHEGPLHVPGGEPVRAHQLGGLAGELREPREGGAVGAAGGAQPLALLEPVDGLGGVLPPAPVDHPGGEQGPVQEDLHAERGGAAHVAVHGEVDGGVVDALRGDLLPLLGVAGAVGGGDGVELDHLRPRLVQPATLQLLGGHGALVAPVRLNAARGAGLGDAGLGRLRLRLVVPSAARGGEDQEGRRGGSGSVSRHRFPGCRFGAHQSPCGRASGMPGAGFQRRRGVPGSGLTESGKRSKFQASGGLAEWLLHRS